MAEHDRHQEILEKQRIKDFHDELLTSAISNAKEEYEKRSKKDVRYENFIDDISRTKDYKVLIKECMTKKRDQVKR